MVLEGFARNELVMKGRNARSYGGKEWTRTGHNLDFIFERDDVAYGVEVKNTLGYMDQEALQTKIEMCKWLGIKPVFVDQACVQIVWHVTLISGPENMKID
jgi:hypothetical protein